MANDTEVTVEASPSDWILAVGSICADLAERYRSLTEAYDRDDMTSAESIKDGIRPLERVRYAIQEAVYAEPEAPDGIDLAREEIDILQRVLG